MPPEARVYFVAYDVKTVGANSAIESRIKRYAYAQPLPSVWLVQTDEGMGSLMRTLEMAINDDDRLMVAELSDKVFWKNAQCGDELMEAWTKAAGRA
jgi:hypothetical protein